MYLAVVVRPLLQAQTALKTEYFKLLAIPLLLGFFSVHSFTHISTCVEMTQIKSNILKNTQISHIFCNSHVVP